MKKFDLLPGSPDAIRKLTLSDSQFCLATERELRPDDPRLVINGMSIWGGGNDAISILSQDNRQVGLAFGTLVDYASDCIVKKELRLPLGCGELEERQIELEDFLYQHAGRWLAIFNHGAFSRIYLDANASRGLVYDPQNRSAGSTAAALLEPEAYSTRFRLQLFRELNVPHVGWFPSGLTAHDGIERLLPNHYLDLNSWKPVRHWPRPDSLPSPGEPSLILAEIGRIIRQQVEILLRSGKVACALTAGNETRFLLSCLAPYWDQVNFVTFNFPTSALDVYTAAKLKESFSLSHELFPAVVSNEHEAREWVYNTGHCVGGSNARFWKSTGALRSYDYFLGGLGGEVARGFFYRPDDLNRKGTRVLTAQELLARMGLPAHRLLLERTETWLQNTPDMNLFPLLDLAYVELRMGPWAFAPCYTPYPTCQLHPLICREIYELMFQLPVETKRSNPLVDFIRAHTLKLLELPINRYGDLRDQISFLKKVSSAERVIRKLRKRFG